MGHMYNININNSIDIYVIKSNDMLGGFSIIQPISIIVNGRFLISAMRLRINPTERRQI